MIFGIEPKFSIPKVTKQKEFSIPIPFNSGCFLITIEIFNKINFFLSKNLLKFFFLFFQKMSEVVVVTVETDEDKEKVEEKKGGL